jgi:isopentenyl diphosphate isomerase/L-lactate dehydrogenase-like FMN-dependent dehydrogenase
VGEGEAIARVLLCACARTDILPGRPGADVTELCDSIQPAACSQLPIEFRAALPAPPEQDPASAIGHFFQVVTNAGLTWADLGFLRQQTRLPILLKGVLHPDDARRAIDCGMAGVIVSNHGGRQVDGAIAALDALPGVVEAVAGRVEVLFDSGIRRGADVFKALALGARSVLLGRPYCYALAVAGEEGVRTVLRNLLADVELTMGLAGCAGIEQLNRELVQAQ